MSVFRLIVWPLLLFLFVHIKYLPVNLKPHTTSVLLPTNIRRKHVQESIQEAEGGRLGKLAPFTAGGVHPLRCQKGSGETREREVQCLELLSISLVLIRDDSSSWVLGLNYCLCRSEPTNLWRPSSGFSWFGLAEAVVHAKDSRRRKVVFY